MFKGRAWDYRSTALAVTYFGFGIKIPTNLEIMFDQLQHYFFFLHLGSFLIDKVVPQANGESSKVKVKVRVNIHGIFTTSSASLVEKTETPEEEAKEEPMEVISLLLKSNANILKLTLLFMH